MSRLLDSEPKAFKYDYPKDRPIGHLATSVIEVLGDDLTSIAAIDDMDKYAILNENGSARNLDRINIENSIYSKHADEDSLIDFLDPLFF